MANFVWDLRARREHNPVMFDALVDGRDCDVLPDATGPFGSSPTNPIPVCSVLGELAYLSRLRSRSGSYLFFHRLASLPWPGGNGRMIDIFETVTRDNRWDLLYLDCRHCRDSRRAPKGYRLIHEGDRDSLFLCVTGSPERVVPFPGDLASPIARWTGVALDFPEEPEPWQEALAALRLRAPEAHERRLQQAGLPTHQQRHVMAAARARFL